MTQDPNHEALNFQAPSLDVVAKLLPNYSFESLIAKGGMGAVYKATQISLDRPVAIKVLPPEFGDDEDFRSSFQTEAKLMARLNHPNLIGIFDFGEIDGMLYIVMELVEGSSLYEKTYGRAIKQETALKLTAGICEGLDHAHAAGILHRDIKPANILLKDKRPKIGDFGLARPTANSETGVIFGTPGYTAPEVITHPKSVDQRADIYSVGIILYELITGEKPGSTYTPASDLVDCHPELDNIICRAIQPDPSRRYADANEMAEEITELLREIKHGSPRSSGSGKKLITSATSPVPVRPAASTVTGPRAARTARKPKLATEPVAVTPAAALATPPAEAPPRPKTPSTPIAVNTSGESALARNIIIIIILLVAIYLVHSMLSQKKEDVEKADRIAAQEQAQRKKERLEAIAAAKSTSQPEPITPRRTPEPEVTPVTPPTPEKTPLETLSDLRSQLTAGTRPVELMPEGTYLADGNSRMRLILDEPMTWHEADRFARQHGGYLATLTTTSDANILASKIPADTAVWIGAGTAGNKSWTWSDGTPASDALDLAKSSKIRFAKISTDAFPTAETPNVELPFVIEWRMDGTNPGTIRERLLLTRQSLNQVNPIYPPGAFSFGNRHYFLAPSESTLEEAKKLAEAAGARLYVPSDPQEQTAVAQQIIETLPPGQKAWIGGLKKGDTWTWITNEPWNEANWDTDFPKTNNGLAITSVTSAPWQDVSTSSSLPFVLLEWSKDKADIETKSLQNDPVATNASLDKLIVKAKELLNKRNQQRENDHQENIERLVWDVDVYFKGLPKNDKMAQQTAIAELKTMIAGKTRVPPAMNNLGPTDKVRGMTGYAYEKQGRIEKEFLDDVEKIRIAYIGQLESLASSLRKKGQISAFRSVQEEAQDSGKTARGFLEHFGID